MSYCIKSEKKNKFLVSLCKSHEECEIDFVISYDTNDKYLLRYVVYIQQNKLKFTIGSFCELN